MKKKSLILILSLIATIILFTISTVTQRKLIHYEPKVTCLFLNQNIIANQQLTSDMFIKGDIPISTVSTTKVVKDFSEIDGLYAKDNLYQGQIAIYSEFDTKENLAIYEVEQGKEKIAIKIKSPENGVAYSIKNNSLVNVYVTIRNDLAVDFMPEMERLSIGNIDEGYTVFWLLKNKQVLESFDNEGERMKESDTNIIDTIILAVTHEEAKQVNLLREIGEFNITGLSSIVQAEMVEEGEYENTFYQQNSGKI